MVFPWQIEQWRQLLRAKKDNRLPHALLFTGIKGTGKTHFAECFIRALLCQRPQSLLMTANTCAELSDTPEVCTCHACRLITGRVHPNLLWVGPEKEGQSIKIDQVRDVSEFINQTSLQGECRIVIIHPAHHMNANAANALLKTLEEPASGAVIILISDQTSRLPATILSRCQHIAFPRPPTSLAIAWVKRQLAENTVDAGLILKLAHGAPLAAIDFVKNKILSLRQDLFQALYLLSQHQSDPIKSAVKIQDIDSLHLLDFMLAWMMDLLRLQLGSHASNMVNSDFSMQLSELSQRTHVRNNTRYMEYLQQLRAQICSGINFNKLLMVENLFVRWMECI
jgi:DNA polymerase III subunit delta'